MRRFVTTLIASAFCFGSASAGSYSYYPGSVFKLGGTFDPKDLTVSYPSCIKYLREYAVHRLDRTAQASDKPPTVKPDANVAAENELSIEQIKTREHLYNFLNISASVSGSYGFFGASASANYQSEETFDSDSFVFGVRGMTTFADVGLVAPDLIPEAKALVKNPPAFYARCGREWVSQETRGVLIAVVYTIKNVSRSQRSKLEAAVSAGFNSPAVGASAKGSLEKILQSAFVSNYYSAKIHFIGGKGVSDFATTINQFDDPAAVIKAISEYLKTLNYENSVPLNFTTGSLDQFLAQAQPDGLFDPYTRRIGDLFLQYQEYKNQKTQVWQFLNQDIQSGWGEKLDKAAWKRIDVLDGAINAIEAKAQVCRKAAKYAASFIDTLTTTRSKSATDDPARKTEFLRDFSVGLAGRLSTSPVKDYGAKIMALATPSETPPSCEVKDQGDVGDAKSVACVCFSTDKTYIKSRFPIASIPTVTVVHDTTFAPRSLLYVAVTSAAPLAAVSLMANDGQEVRKFTGGYDPEKGPVFFGSVLFRDGSGNPPPPDKLPYYVKITDNFGRIYTKPIVPID